MGASWRRLECRTEDEGNPFPGWNIKPTNVSSFPPVMSSCCRWCFLCVYLCVFVCVFSSHLSNTRTVPLTVFKLMIIISTNRRMSRKKTNGGDLNVWFSCQLLQGWCAAGERPVNDSHICGRMIREYPKHQQSIQSSH